MTLAINNNNSIVYNITLSLPSSQGKTLERQGRELYASRPLILISRHDLPGVNPEQRSRS